MFLDIFINMKGLIRKLVKESLMKEITTGGYFAYHGTNKNISKFVDDFVGSDDATDEEGPGIYFTTDYEDAAGYGNLIYSVRIGGDRFIEDDSNTDNVDINELIELIKMAEDWEINAQDYHEDPDMGAEVAASYAIEYNQLEKDAFLEIWVGFYRYDGLAFVRNMVKLGYDGIVTSRYRDKNREGKHIIVYNPNIIEFKSVDNVENTN